MIKHFLIGKLLILLHLISLHLCLERTDSLEHRSRLPLRKCRCMLEQNFISNHVAIYGGKAKIQRNKIALSLSTSSGELRIPTFIYYVLETAFFEPLGIEIF
jgi:hypothetical protein